MSCHPNWGQYRVEVPWRQRPDMTVAVDCAVKQLIKEANRLTNQRLANVNICNIKN